MPDISDLDAFFRLQSDGGFAVEAGYTNAAGATVTIPVHFNSEFIAVAGPDGAVAEKVTAVTCRSADVPDISMRGKISVNGSNYTIKEWHPDGTGITNVYLTLAI